MQIAIIGTAGRDKSQPMSLALWDAMVADAMHHIPHDAHLVSGGAAWADHLAVVLFLNGHVRELTLHLPAPFDSRFLGPQGSSASAANYYHERFSNVIGRDSFNDIHIASCMDNCHGSFQPAAVGYAAMFKRNALVAKVNGMLAYTFGTGNVPADGGTLATWNMCTSTNKYHIPLHSLI